MRCSKVICHLLALCCAVWSLASCSEWDTDTLGQSFVPANSQVRTFTHLVYVEYSLDGVRVWGPAASEVTATFDGHHAHIVNTSDSLALFAYGYPDAKGKDEAKDSNAIPIDASLTIDSPVPYALYLGGLSLHSQSRPVIHSVGQQPCYMVLPNGSNNQFKGQILVDGPLHLTGRGKLSIDSRGTCLQAQSLQCQYNVSVSLQSTEGDGIELTGGPMRSTLGTWTIHAAHHGVTSPDSIVLIAGTYQGSAATGAFFDARRGTLSRRPTLLAAAMLQSQLHDTAYVAQRFDSVQPFWQQQVDTLQLQAATAYKVFRNSEKREFTSFTAHSSLSRPWMLISNATLLPSDTVYFRH